MMFSDRSKREDAAEGHNFLDLKGLAFAATVAVVLGCGKSTEPAITPSPSPSPSPSVSGTSSNLNFSNVPAPTEQLKKYARLSSSEIITSLRKEGVKVVLIPAHDIRPDVRNLEDVSKLRLESDQEAEKFYNKKLGGYASLGATSLVVYNPPYFFDRASNGDSARPYIDQPLIVTADKTSKTGLLLEATKYWLDREPPSIDSEGKKIHSGLALVLKSDAIDKMMESSPKDVALALEGEKLYVKILNEDCKRLEGPRLLIENKEELNLSESDVLSLLETYRRVCQEMTLKVLKRDLAYGGLKKALELDPTGTRQRVPGIEKAIEEYELFKAKFDKELEWSNPQLEKAQLKRL